MGKPDSKGLRERAVAVVIDSGCDVIEARGQDRAAQRGSVSTSP